ncbi:MAG: hypothetical protein ACK52I_00830 [Pseudomonadota bacterium]
MKNWNGKDASDTNQPPVNTGRGHNQKTTPMINRIGTPLSTFGSSINISLPQYEGDNIYLHVHFANGNICIPLSADDLSKLAFSFDTAVKAVENYPQAVEATKE